jgi:hypothetical protein
MRADELSPDELQALLDAISDPDPDIALRAVTALNQLQTRPTPVCAKSAEGLDGDHLWSLYGVCYFCGEKRAPSESLLTPPESIQSTEP